MQRDSSRRWGDYQQGCGFITSPATLWGVSEKLIFLTITLEGSYVRYYSIGTMMTAILNIYRSVRSINCAWLSDGVLTTKKERSVERSFIGEWYPQNLTVSGAMMGATPTSSGRRLKCSDALPVRLRLLE
ncbi:hypothetical protein IAD21_01238 [Abditibacteriota bacterium]|nr:hypothetical protein IAD21_01238 [Abditibacteriota bacterium]